MLIFTLSSLFLAGLHAYWGSNPVWIAMGMVPLLLRPWVRPAHQIDPDLDTARLSMLSREFDHFELIHSLPDSANDTFVVGDEPSIVALRFKLVEIQETLSLAIASTHSLKSVIDSIKETAEQARLIAAHGLFCAAEMGDEGRGYASVCVESARIAERGLLIHRQSAPVLLSIENMAQRLMTSIQDQLSDIHPTQALSLDTLRALRQLGLDIRRECHEVEHQIRELSGHEVGDAPRYKGLTQILSATRNCTGALIELSGSFEHWLKKAG